MRTSYLIHGFWVLIAIGAFAVGKMQQARPDNASGDSEPSARRTSRPLSQSKSAREGGSARASADGTSPLGTGRELSPEAMTAALTKVLAETDPIVRQRRFAELLESLTAENAQAAVQALQDAPRSRWSWGQEYSLLTHAWGRLDGPAAVAYARELEGRTREWTMASALSGWANQDPEAAKQWVSGIEDDGERSSFTRGLVYLIELPAGGERDAAVGAYARRVTDEEPESAIAWAQSIGSEELRDETITRTAREWLRHDVAAASTWLESAQLSEAVVQEILRPSDNGRGRDRRRR